MFHHVPSSAHAQMTVTVTVTNMWQALTVTVAGAQQSQQAHTLHRGAYKHRRTQSQRAQPGAEPLCEPSRVVS